MTAAAISNQHVRRSVTDRATPGDPAWKDDDGKATAVLELIIPTLVRPEMDAADAGKFLLGEAAQAQRRAASFASLAAAGWEMLEPVVINPDEGYQDVRVRFTRRFTDAGMAERTARQDLGTAADDTWCLGWDLDSDDVQSWMEL